MTLFGVAHKHVDPMQRRRVRLAAALVLALVGSAAAVKPVAPPPAAARNDETQAFLRQMGDAQKWMGEELWKLKEKVDDDHIPPPRKGRGDD